MTTQALAQRREDRPDTRPAGEPAARTAHDVGTALAAPFDPKDVKFKPQMVKNNRCLAMPYIDARLIQDRLDEAVGVENWQDGYKILPDGSVVCRLRVKFADRWVSKTDVGSPSEQPDGGDRLKAAFSDALKRAAVKFGIGRYLYRVPPQWVDYDPVKKQIVAPPQLPAFALPVKKSAPPPASAPAPEVPATAAPAGVPANGNELVRRLRAYEEKLVGRKVCAANELFDHVVRVGVAAGYPPTPAAWSGPAIALAVVTVQGFEADRSRPAGG